VEWECPAGMAVPLLAVVTYRGSRLRKGDILLWRIFYSEWVLNATVRLITDVHHLGLLWSLPRKIIDNISVLSLPFLLEGTRCDVERATQLLGIVGSEELDCIRAGRSATHSAGRNRLVPYGHGSTVPCPGAGRCC
jgi:hypothetical protein